MISCSKQARKAPSATIIFLFGIFVSFFKPAPTKIKLLPSIRSLIKEILDYPGALICNVCIDNDFRVIPQVKFGKPNEDMEPLLPREMFKENMIIEPID